MKFFSLPSRYIGAVPVLLSTSLLAALVYARPLNHLFPPLVLGVIAGGLVDLDNGLTGKLKNIVYTLLAFAVSSLAVEAVISRPAAYAAVMTVQAFVFTFLGAAGQRYRTIAFGTLAVAVYTALTHDDAAPWYQPTLLILCGTLLYSLCALLTHIIFPNRPVQDNMAAAYRALADFLTAKSDFFDPDEAEHLEQQQITLAMSNSAVTAAFNQCRSALFYRMRGQHRHPRTVRLLRCYYAAQDIHERISSSHVHYRDFAEAMRYSDLIYRIQRLLRLQADTCREFARTLADDSDFVLPAKLERAGRGAEASLQHYAATAADGAVAPYRVQRLLDNILHVSLQLGSLKSPERSEGFEYNHQTRLHAPESSGFKSAWRSLKAQGTLHSPVFRHAVRMAAIVLACCLIIQVINTTALDREDLSLGYWILMTAVFVCQPNYSATKKRLIQRILGTVFGIVAAAALPFLSLSLAHKLGIAVLSTTLFFYFRSNKQSFSTFFITIQAVVGFSIIGSDTRAFFLPRLLDTLIGASVAGLAVYFLWPDWKYLALDKTGAQAVESNAAYLRAVLRELESGIRDDMDYRIARRLSHDRAAALSSTLSDMSGEPDKHGSKLADGFLLLKINYSLISYIAALGAYRNKMQPENAAADGFIHEFLAAGSTAADILENLPRWDESRFQAALGDLQAQLESLRPDADAGETRQVLWQQLTMIAGQLRPGYQALHPAADSTPAAQAA